MSVRRSFDVLNRNVHFGRQTKITHLYAKTHHMYTFISTLKTIISRARASPETMRNNALIVNIRTMTEVFEQKFGLHLHNCEKLIVRPNVFSAKSKSV